MDEREQEELELKLSMYLDGELADSERDQLEARLRDDPEARVMLQDLLGVHARLELLGENRAAERRRQMLRRRLFAVAFLAILGLLALIVVALAR